MSSCSSCRLANCYQTEGLKPSTVLLTLPSQCSLWKSLSGLQGVMWWCNDTVGQLALHGASLNPRLTLCVQVRSRGRRSAWWFWIWWEVVNFAHEGLQWWRVISDSVQLPSALWINLIQFLMWEEQNHQLKVLSSHCTNVRVQLSERNLGSELTVNRAQQLSSHHDAHWKNKKTAAN